MTSPMSPAWSDLIEGLTLLATHPADQSSPLWAEHDTLHVCADETQFSDEEITKLEGLGFYVHGEGGFYSHRFGSA